jgi:hypothetical protein
MIAQLQILMRAAQGGYNFRSISKSALAVAKTLMGEPPDRLISTTASTPAIQIVRRVMTAQSKYWKCMYPKVPPQEGLFTDRVHGNGIHLLSMKLNAALKIHRCHSHVPGKAIV